VKEAYVRKAGIPVDAGVCDADAEGRVLFESKDLASIRLPKTSPSRSSLAEESPSRPAIVLSGSPAELHESGTWFASYLMASDRAFRTNWLDRPENTPPRAIGAALHFPSRSLTRELASPPALGSAGRPRPSA